MSGRKNISERRILIYSALLTLGFAVGGIVLGNWVGSMVIIFDGAYSLVSLALTLLSLLAATLMARPNSKRFPHGLAALEPIVIAIKAAVILGLVCISIYSAIISVFEGGREIDTSVATLFGLINVIGCAFGWALVANKNKKLGSGLIAAEIKQWQMDTLISVAVLLGFVVAWLLLQTSLSAYAVYADPVMMLLMAGYFLKVPAVMLKEALSELLHMSANNSLCNEVHQCVTEVPSNNAVDLTVSSVTKVGNELRIDIDMHIEEQIKIAPKDIEITRNQLAKKLKHLPYKCQLNLSLVV
ncbi:cobalt-zinc-cadmium resistance protein [Vibrio inusitatus NBRC 102082]|uniref:Cobalt-zinc-cadmium resistance protein n=1 Tax=Vibrio inusitatus NBRC 102082 TaxID=1219070 RepID=A0A4Y3HWM3_9VIBR|nr:cation diffusion facilitator family transporter [Vibrio inusitatus]GEA50674.1 cobalt-zinc-cadmium resistance protein [Vibrio inusitatus NBRC 102082]